MKKLLVFLCAMLLFVGFAGMANATLFDRGNGLIYDDVLDITWLQDANYAQTSGYDEDGRMDWDVAVAWADSLDYGGYEDWRLPTSVYAQHVYGVDGTTTAGYNVTSSEMGYMYYVNLNNQGYYDTDGDYVGDGNWGLNNTSFESGGPGGPTVSFQNLQPGVYWSGTGAFGGPGYAWHFRFGNGEQTIDLKVYDHWAWAVRPGDSAPVPEPATMLLLGTGLIGIAGYSRKKFKK